MYGCRDSVTKRPHKFVQQFSFRHSIQFHLTIFSVLVVITYFFFVSLSDFFPPPLIFTLFFFLFSILSVSKNHQNTSTYMLFSLLIFRSWYKFYSRQSENCSTNAGRLACTESLFVHLQYCFCWCFFFEDLIFFGIISKLWKLCFFSGRASSLMCVRNKCWWVVDEIWLYQKKRKNKKKTS